MQISDCKGPAMATATASTTCTCTTQPRDVNVYQKSACGGMFVRMEMDGPADGPGGACASKGVDMGMGKGTGTGMGMKGGECAGMPACMPMACSCSNLGDAEMCELVVELLGCQKAAGGCA